MPLGRLILFAVAMVILSMFGGNLLAQGAPYNGEYPPSPQSDYADPNYQQPEAYPQQQYTQQAYPQQSYSEQGYGQAQPLNAEDLEQLVAPIALYPDALVAQVLAASTYPAQVEDADHWRRAQGYASPEQIAAGADSQPWDPSVKALTAFPQVLSQMDQNRHWTEELGNAYYNEPQDLLQAVQVMRRRAQEAGNLQSTPQEAVNYDQGNIELEPANPQVVYVPSYNPWGVYGEPVAPYPGFASADAVGSFFSAVGEPAVRFGLGIALSAFTNTPWGWLGWGLNWLTQSVLFNHSDYFSHSASVSDWGLRYGGPRAFGRRGEFAMRSNRSFGSFGRYGRGGEFGRGRSQGFGRTRNEDAYARNRSGERYGRGFDSRNNYGARGSSNRFQPAVSRSRESSSSRIVSQHYGRTNYGSYSNNRSAGSRGNFAGASYRDSTRGPMQSSRQDSMRGSMQNTHASRGNFQRSEFGRSSGSFKGNGFSKSYDKQARSGGFHFGGGHSAKSYGGGKSFSHGHSGGGHSGGAGHSGGHGHSGGGGHSGGKHHH